MRSVAVALIAILLAGSTQAATPANQDRPADLTAAQVRAALAAATPEHKADFSGKSLRELDLSGADLAGANLSGVNLFGTKLDGANLTGANLTGANLNLAWLIHANFTKANLTNASLVAPVVAEGLAPKPGEIPVFKGANLTGARVQARFTGGNLAGAMFTGADVSAHMNNQSMGLMRTEMGGADLAGADFSGADLGHALLAYANLHGAKFSGAKLNDADLTGVDATGANFTDADLTGADFTNAKLIGAIGLDRAKGYKAKNGS